jgi:hypothetical protein
MSLIGTLTRVWGLKQEVVLWTLELGRYKSGKEYCEALKAARIDRWRDIGNGYLQYSIAENPRFVCAPERTEVDLVVLTVDGDFGYRHGTCWGNIDRDRHRFGLELCPAEVGPALRLAYQVQPEGQRSLDIMMEPLICSQPMKDSSHTYDYPILWSLLHRCDRGLALEEDRYHLPSSMKYRWGKDFHVDAYQQLVFVKPRPRK